LLAGTFPTAGALTCDLFDYQPHRRPPRSSAMPPEPSKPTPTKSTNEIFKDPANDILLCSSDNVTFPFRKLHLESASEVFEGMLSVGREGSRKVLHSDTAALEVVDLAEEAQLLEKYLVFIHPRTANPTIKSYEELEKCVVLFSRVLSREPS
jgi:hypothetical protein